MYKLDIQKREEPEIKLPTFIGSWRNQWNSRKTSTSASLTILKLLSVWITNKMWKILKETGIPDHLMCLLRNLYAGQEAIVRIKNGTTDWIKISKGVWEGCILSPCLFNLYSKYIVKCWAGRITSCCLDAWEKYQPLKIFRWYHSNDRKLKRNRSVSCSRWKRKAKKTGLKLNNKKAEIISSSPITSWQTKRGWGGGGGVGKWNQWQILFY